MAKVMSRKLVILKDGGMINGKPRTTKDTYTGVSPTVTDDKLLLVAQGIASLCDASAIDYHKIETTKLA